ncbi:hypothetical protein KP509_11G057700 [Ceratopteris richardii]|uniref:Bidirectional sugar transporter SWEET n=1 Tax=Ceratopteris richardii TaxID=49495 RepID=A0A8T2TSV5_CERRI|nr:hypothetical protein KP509_11G057700 [Ceratopteris richardii]
MRMRNESIAFIIGVIGNVTATLVYASPTVTFYRIAKKKDSGSFSPIPYITCLLSTSLWTYYGVIKPNGFLIASTCSIGMLLQAFYIAIYIAYATVPKRMRAIKLLVISWIAFIAFLLSTLFGSSGDKRLTIIGYICAITSIISYASPLSIMRKVIATKSVEYMPLLLSLSIFVNGGTWVAYSFIVKDAFLGVPTGTGWLLGTLQLLLYVCYYERTPKKSNVVKTSFETINICTEGQEELGQTFKPEEARRQTEPC